MRAWEIIRIGGEFTECFTCDVNVGLGGWKINGKCFHERNGKMENHEKYVKTGRIIISWIKHSQNWKTNTKTGK